MSDAKTSKQYKDRLFCKLFGSEEYKENMLSLYNAINGTDHSNPDDITIYTIGNVIYVGMHNDVSLILDSYLSLWEQQSSVNPNMPLRGLMYFGKMYDRYIEEYKLSIYGKTLVKIPTPKYTVLYNGPDDYPAYEKQRLSDAFANPDHSGEFEWTATVYNLNKDNSELLKRCKALREYMDLVQRIRENQKTMSTFDAVDEAVTYCIANGILTDFLRNDRAEVIEMCLTEFNEVTYERSIREEGRMEMAFECVQEGVFDPACGARMLGIPESEFLAQMNRAGYKVPVSVN